MSTGFGLFEHYESASTRQLAQISSSKYPDTNKDFEANIRRINSFVDYIAQYLQVMQKGVDKANADPITRIKDMVADFTVLFGGGELLYGINLGDLQYFLPALGAIFGFDSTTPFPINLFNAVEHLFLGYVVPLDAFVSEIQDIIDGWLVALGIDQTFIDAFGQLMTALGGVVMDLEDFFNSLASMLDIFGISLDGLGPFADLWHVITQLLGGLSLHNLGDLIDPIFTAAAPWVQTLAVFIGWLDDILKGFNAGISGVDGFLNFSQLFTAFVDFSSITDSLDAIWQWANGALFPAGVLGITTPVPAFNLFGSPSPSIFDQVPLAALTNFVPQLLANPIFSPGAVALNNEWVQDSTITTDPNNPQAGSMVVEADGGIHELYSDAISVQAGHQVSMSIDIEWTDLAYTGTKPIQLRAAGFFKTQEVDVSGGGPIKSKSISGPTSPAANGTWLTLTGTWTVPAGVDESRMVLYIGANASTGAIRWSWPRRSKDLVPGVAPIDWTFGLQGWLDDLNNFTQSVIDYVMQAITGLPSVGATLTDLYNEVLSWFDDTQTTAGQASDAWGWVIDTWNWLLSLFGMPSQTTPNTGVLSIASVSIPPVNVVGIQGMPTIDQTIKTMLDQWYAAFGLTAPATGFTVPQVSSVAQTVAQRAQDSHAMAVDNANILGFRNNAPTHAGFDDTSQSNMPVTSIVASTSSVFASTGGPGYPAAVIRCEKTGPIGAISFIADKQASTSFYLVIYKIDFATNTLVFQHRSTNIAASLAGSGVVDWARYVFAGTPVNVTMGEDLVVVFQSNSGSKVFGAPYTLKAHPTANMGSLGASVTIAALPAGTGNIAAANWSFSTATTFGGGTTVIPYAAAEIVNVPPDYHNPDKMEWLIAGTYSYVIPPWAKFVDLIGVGGGNRGQVIFGGGRGGTWATTTLTLPTAGGVAAGDTLTIVVGAGGDTAADTNGVASTVKKGATSLLSAAGSSAFSGTDYGLSPGDIRYNNTSYWGGPQVWTDSNGIAPGGGGGKTLQALHGGNGGVWLEARQT